MTTRLVLFALLALGLAVVVRAEEPAPFVEAPLIEVYCPIAEPCPPDDLDADPYVLTGFRQLTNPAVYYYWSGQVPCAALPCPLGGNILDVPDAAIQAGVEEWSTVPSPWETDFQYANEMPASSICGGLFTGLEQLARGRDGRNTIMWAPLGGSTIGIACWGADGEADIILDNTWPGAAVAENTRTVLLHEVGHGEGLGHSAVAGAVMFPTFVGPTHLQPDDIAGFCAIYGCAPVTPLPPTPTPTPVPEPPPVRCGIRAWPDVIPTCYLIPGVARDG